jgi:hypothetical protein
VPDTVQIQETPDDPRLPAPANETALDGGETPLHHQMRRGIHELAVKSSRRLKSSTFHWGFVGTLLVLTLAFSLAPRGGDAAYLWERLDHSAHVLAYGGLMGGGRFY